MRNLLELGMFLPEWVMPWICLVAIAAAIMGWNRLAAALGLFVAIDIFVFPMLEPFFDQLPIWVLILCVAFIPLYLLHSLIQFVFGKETAGTFTGIWLLRVSDAIILMPFRFVRLLWRLLFH